MNIFEFLRRKFTGGIGIREWTNLPPWTSQYSVATRTDALDCLSESLGNILFMVQGFDSSPRALAKLSNTTHSGNYKENVLTAANHNGLIPYHLWPTPDDFNWDSYYAPIPKAVLDSGIGFRVKQVSPNLAISPLWTILRFPGGMQHGVAQISPTHYFDSELGSPVKPLNYGGATVVSQTSLIFTPMTNAKLIRHGDEWGFFLPATNDSAMIDKALNLNYPLPTMNNGTKVDWTNIHPDFTV